VISVLYSNQPNSDELTGMISEWNGFYGEYYLRRLFSKEKLL
jgi:hypothetical protein